MEIYYNVKLDKISNIYFLSNIKCNLNYKIKLQKINKMTIDNNDVLAFALDCDNIVREKNKIFRNIKHIKRKNKELLNNCFQIIVFNYQKDNEQNIIDLIRSIKVMLLPTILEKYEYIYDTVCDFLDNEFICKNICEFKNDKCIAKRNFNITCGCCRHYKSLFSNQLIQCEYLINKRCSTKCLTCKMFTCNYIVKHKKIKYKIRDMFLLDKFFNPIQKIIILISYFTSKEKIIKRLLIWR